MKQKIGIYVHIPFCKQKCLYCDFVSFEGIIERVEKYIEILKQEILENAKKAENYIVTTIYMGGGTPSYIESKFIVDILETIKKNYTIKKDAEITIEVNPGTVTKEKLEDYKRVGINRLSIGLQSTNNEILKEIGRIHTYEDFLETYKLVKKVGFQNINVDLMLALPKQTYKDLQKSLEQVIKLSPKHISLYSLILEKGTKLEKLVEQESIILPEEEIERKMYWDTKKVLEDNGYIHYEISNFAKEGYESKHNLNCWNQEPYLGFGISAHSYYNKTRYSNVANLNKYGVQPKIIYEIQSKQDEQKEYMMLGLRKISGVSISDFKNKFIQNPIYLFRKELDKLVKENLLEIDEDRIKLTNRGLDLANLVWEEFV